MPPGATGESTLPQDVAALRSRIRAGQFVGTTSGLCPGRVQANVVVLPQAHASDFRRFCEQNPRPCPLLEVTAPGVTAPPATAPEADLRTDVPRYRVFRDGRLVAEPTDVSSFWRDDLVTFLLGCSFTFERALLEAGLPLRHQQQGRVVPMYVTHRSTVPAGPFRGPLVVSMRPVPAPLVPVARVVTERYPLAHGGPLHAGDPAGLGIRSLDAPDLGEPVRLEREDVPLFWACGVTPQLALAEARLELVITHAPGHMLLTDLEEPGARPV